MIPYRRYVVEYAGAPAHSDVIGRQGRHHSLRSITRRETVRAASESQAVWRVIQRAGGSAHRIVGREL